MAGIRKDFRSNRLAIFIICSIFFQFGHSTDESEKNTDGQCIWYGVCRNYEDRGVDKSQYCSYNGTAKLLSEEGRQNLMTYCSYLDQGENNTFTCCDSEQIEIMNDNIERAEFILSDCPACFHNFVQPICAMTCSPKQSQFLKVNQLDDKESEYGPYVTSIDYAINHQYIDATFQSCKEVKFLLIMKSVNMMCGGAKDADCTSHKWYNFMGNYAINKYVPFQTNYITDPLNGYTSFNRSTVPCYKAVNESKGKCSCSDCSGSCAPN
ncbi:NPC intracellular cholesterol transporter 1-like [Sitodiplosis mosellana]|uniref:NPC intracellular cholesterol transporter 1-like n=1 Tax=Sitodiplosis mosellana TaxID=263140 RepID=UPI0024439502|nr:NPC intracellular cholesterol transporter 1-like [Sitodiplosis mosellana]